MMKDTMMKDTMIKGTIMKDTMTHDTLMIDTITIIFFLLAIVVELSVQWETVHTVMCRLYTVQLYLVTADWSQINKYLVTADWNQINKQKTLLTFCLYKNPKYAESQNLTLIQDMVIFDGPTK